ncbi:ATP/GTP-binding protein [Lasiosphaeria hispida]|uniref:ATP/GTP-binding protein n=1 Tax=Lasiosphaeria hispida TaxID=260671 RepID=A0AAJ0HNW3_9PEZI|nr:ATP/GTP-binding protein [Lasiosphaeria hispida]
MASCILAAQTPIGRIVADQLEKLQLPLSRTQDDPRPVVVMTCGIAGSGKSTFSKAIVAQQHPMYERLSVDAMIHAKHGIYGVDYPENMYSEYLEEASDNYERRLIELLNSGEKNIAFDRALYSKKDRDYFKALIEEKGARWILVFFHPSSKEVIWNRIQRRRKAEINADSAFVITRDTFDGYWEGFENPEGEGEVVIEVLA